MSREVAGAGVAIEHAHNLYYMAACTEYFAPRFLRRELSYILLYIQALGMLTARGSIMLHPVDKLNYDHKK